MLKMAKTTSDPKVVAGLIEAAADLKEQAGELPSPISIRPPDVRTDHASPPTREKPPRS